MERCVNTECTRYPAGGICVCVFDCKDYQPDKKKTTEVKEK